MHTPDVLDLPELTEQDFTAMAGDLGAIIVAPLFEPILDGDRNKKDTGDWPADAPTRTSDAPPGGDNPSKGGGRDDSQPRRKD